MGLDKIEQRHIAMLIDCDNASHRAVKGVLKELSKEGEVIIKHAYGNWSSPHLKGWESRLLESSIRPIQQYDYTKGKNATDIAMVIDAMDLMYTKNIYAFALVTSDSDFTPLAMRLMSNGLKVFGFGEKKTPKAFVNACSQFIYTENLEEEEKRGQNKVKEVVRKKQKIRDYDSKIDVVLDDEEFIDLLLTALRKTANEDGWSNTAELGNYLRNNSSFSPLNYGYEKLGTLLENIPFIESKRQKNNTILYVRER